MKKDEEWESEAATNRNRALWEATKEPRKHEAGRREKDQPHWPALKNNFYTRPSRSPAACRQVDHIRCCPTVSLCQLAFHSGLVKTRVSIFHHTITASQAEAADTASV